MTQWIAGQWVEGEGGSLQSTTPYDGSVIWSGTTAGASQVEIAVQTARNTFLSWKNTPIKAREEILMRYADVVKAHQDLLAETIAKETGKPLWEARTEAASVAAKVTVSLRAYHDRTGTYARSIRGQRIVLRHRPLGVMAVFGPYNSPCHLPNGHIVPALLAGNTIVFKPSEQTPMSGELLVKLWHEAGLPAGVLNLVQGGKETGVALAQSKGIDGLLFTGSAATGHHLHQSFAGHPEKMLALEMGGNNPLLISDDFGDLDAAVYHIIQSAFITSGQRCTCARRLYVHQQSSHLITRLCEIVEQLIIDQPFAEPAPFMGPLISEQAVEDILQAQKNLCQLGVTPLLEAKAGGAAFVSPGILDVTDIKELPDEEYFGPLLQVVRYYDLSQAIEMANETRYGLSAGLISQKEQEWFYFIDHVRAGIVNWNRPLTGASGEMPFGGVGASGNYCPSAYYAADYCAYPMASMESDHLVLPTQLNPGVLFDSR
jgi:succinylglutamic semialdehyde dehydrogenase